MNKDKGAALLLSLLILSAIMVIAFSISALMYGELKLTQNIPKSIKAYYAADSGIERLLYDERKGGGAGDIPKCSIDLDNNSSYGIEFTDGDPIEIKSWGCFDDVNRAIEVTY